MVPSTSAATGGPIRDSKNWKLLEAKIVSPKNAMRRQHAVPRLAGIGIISHIHVTGAPQDDRGDIASKLVHAAAQLNAVCQRLAQDPVAVSGCCGVLVVTDNLLAGVFQGAANASDVAGWVQLQHAAVEQFEYVQLFTTATYERLLVDNMPSDCDVWWALGSQSTSSTYQLGKGSFALIRAANPDCCILQFDLDTLGSVESVVALVGAIVREAESQSRQILSGGYVPLLNPGESASRGLRKLIDGTSTRVAQLACASDVLAAFEAGQLRRTALIDIAQAAAFHASLADYGVHVYEQVIAGSGLHIPGTAAAPPYTCDRCMCVWGDDHTQALIHADLDGISARRLPDAAVGQRRHATGLPLVQDAVWHVTTYLPRLVHGIAYLAAVRTDEYRRCLRERRPLDAGDRITIWSQIGTRVGAAVRSFQSYDDTLLGVAATGREHPLFGKLERHNVVGTPYAPHGLAAALRETDSLDAAGNARPETLAGQLHRLLQDVEFYLQPAYHELWSELKSAAVRGVE